MMWTVDSYENNHIILVNIYKEKIALSNILNHLHIFHLIGFS